MLSRFFKPGIAVANHAESVETLKSFVTGLRFAKVLSQLKEGDWVFLQFGHNKPLPDPIPLKIQFPIGSCSLRP